MAIATTTLTVVAIAAVALAAAGAATSAYAAHEQGKYQQKVANFNAKVAQNNALAAEQQAAYDAARIRDRNRRIAGSQRAAAGKSGLTLSSFEDVFIDSAQQGEMDALITMYRGGVESTGYRTDALLEGSRGAAARAQGNFGALSEGLSGAANTAGTVTSNPQFRGR